MTKLTVDLEDLKPLIKQAQDTKGNIEQLYNQSRIYLSIARSDSNMAETYYRNSKTQLDTIVNVLQTTYNALMELQAAEPPRSPSTGNGLQEWITKMVDYSDPTIWGLARKVAVGAWNWLTTPSVDQLLAKMKNNSELAYQASTQQFAEANISSIRLREQLKEHNKELYDEMLELAKVYAQGGQSAVEERLARLKETNPELYEKVAPYAEYARYFDEATESPLTTLSTYQARIEKLQKEWFEVDADDTLTAEQKKEKQNALHETANQYRDLMNKQFPEASIVYELLSESKKTTTTVDGMKSIMNSLANNHPALAGMLSELGRADLAMDIYKGYQDQTIKSSNLTAAEAYKQKLGETLSMAFPLAAAVLSTGADFKNFYTGDSARVVQGQVDREVIKKTEGSNQETNQILQSRLGGNPSYTEIIDYITEASKRLGLPPQIGLAAAWTENKMTQFEDDGRPSRGDNKNSAGEITSSDWGLMQLNDYWLRNEYDFEKIKSDWRYNVDAGLNELTKNYKAALNKGETDVARAVYSGYNAGSSNMARYRNTTDARDENFFKYYNSSPWESKYEAGSTGMPPTLVTIPNINSQSGGQLKIEAIDQRKYNDDGCAIASMAMVLNYYGANVTYTDVERKFITNRSDYLLRFEAAANSIGATYSEARGLTEQKVIEKAKETYLEGKPLIIQLLGNNLSHFVVVVGITGEGVSAADVEIIDPWNGVHTTLDKAQYYGRAAVSSWRLVSE
jgi:hypothetical protein